MADIEAMFHQVKVSPEDQSSLKFPVVASRGYCEEAKDVRDDRALVWCHFLTELRSLLPEACSGHIWR